MNLAERLNSYAVEASRISVEAHFARINWQAHVVPATRTAFMSFRESLKAKSLQDIYSHMLSEGDGLSEHTQEWWSDSITFSFGNRPVPVRPVVKVPVRNTCLVETQASLVIAQTVSGAITAVIYPPTSKVSKPQKDYYVVAVELDPRTVSVAWIIKLLKLTFEVDVFCGAFLFPNKRGGRLMARLLAKHVVLAEGGSRLWVWLRYMYSATTGMLRLYGIGKPAP